MELYEYAIPDSMIVQPQFQSRLVFCLIVRSQQAARDAPCCYTCFLFGCKDSFTMIKDMIDKQVLELKKLWANKRQLMFQLLNLAMIVFSALMIWKGLMFMTKVRPASIMSIMYGLISQYVDIQTRCGRRGTNASCFPHWNLNSRPIPSLRWCHGWCIHPVTKDFWRERILKISTCRQKLH
jgi:hypothetical protein